MIIDTEATSNKPLEQRRSHNGAEFAAAMAQQSAAPLFSPWPATDASVRATASTANAALNTHPTTSNRREGRHSRG